MFHPTAPLSPQELARLPIFPLPEAVLMPGTLLPLHIFEPRYKEMMAFVLAHDSPLVIAQLLPEGADDLGRPPIHPIAGVGRLHQHSRRDDGRFDIVLRGVSRVRLLEELDEPDLPFRLGSFLVIEDASFDARAAADALVALRGMVISLAPRRPRLAAVLHSLVTPGADPGRVGNLMASMLLPTGEERQQVLEMRDPVARLDKMIEALAEMLPMADASDAEAS